MTMTLSDETPRGQRKGSHLAPAQVRSTDKITMMVTMSMVRRPMVFRSRFTYAYSSAVISGLSCRCGSAPLRKVPAGTKVTAAWVSDRVPISSVSCHTACPGGMREWTSSILLRAFGLLDCFLARAAPGFFGILLSFPLVIMRRHVYNQPSFETEQRPGAVAPSRV